MWTKPFQHLNLHEIGLYLNGQQQHAVQPIEPNFADGQYIRAYNTIFAGTGKLGSDEGLFITSVVRTTETEYTL